MSFWAGILLENQAILLIDRCDVMEVKFSKFRKVFHRKYIELNPKTFLLPGGSLYMAKEILKVFKNRFGSDPISIPQIFAFQKEFRQNVCFLWNKVKEPYKAALERYGRGIPNVDCCLAGTSSRGRPYLINFNDANDFNFQILEYPGASFFSPCGPLEEMVKKRVSQFLGKVMGRPESEQREIARSELKNLIPSIAVHNRFVSPAHDLIFLGQDGMEVYHVGFLRSIPLVFKARQGQTI
jgi:hypothetical protein